MRTASKSPPIPPPGRFFGANAKPRPVLKGCSIMKIMIDRHSVLEHLEYRSTRCPAPGQFGAFLQNQHGTSFAFSGQHVRTFFLMHIYRAQGTGAGIQLELGWPTPRTSRCQPSCDVTFGALTKILCSKRGTPLREENKKHNKIHCFVPVCQLESRVSVLDTGQTFSCLTS